MASPSYNYGYDAVARSSGVVPTAMFAGSQSGNLPTSNVGTAIAVTVPSQAPGAPGVAIPVTVFQNGPGLYLLNCNGNGNNDIQTFGYANINAAGALAGCSGFFGQNVSPDVAVVGAAATYQISFLSAGVPFIYQNTGAQIVYNVQATKIAN